jgi:quinolinate synthase
MKLTTLMDVYNCVNGTGGKEIVLSEETIKEARRSIDKMIELGSN